MEPNKKSNLDRLIDEKCYSLIYNAMTCFIEDNPDKLELCGGSSSVENPNTASLSEMEFIKTCNAVSDEDEISFEVIISCEIEIEGTVRRNRETDSVTQWFRIQCKAVLEEKLKSFQVIGIDVYSRQRGR